MKDLRDKVIEKMLRDNVTPNGLAELLGLTGPTVRKFLKGEVEAQWMTRKKLEQYVNTEKD